MKVIKDIISLLRQIAEELHGIRLELATFNAPTAPKEAQKKAGQTRGRSNQYTDAELYAIMKGVADGLTWDEIAKGDGVTHSASKLFNYWGNRNSKTSSAGKRFADVARKYRIVNQMKGYIKAL